MTWMMLSLAFAAEPNWDGLRTESGWKDLGERRSSVGPVNVRTKSVDGVGCVEGRTTVSASTEQLVTLSRDMVSALEWSSADLAESVEIERSTPNEYVLFQYYDAPGWTFTADRYWVIRGTASERGYRYVRVPAEQFPSAKDKALERSGGAIEPPVNYGEWVFSERSDGTEVLYRSCADVGGRLPDRLVHWLNTTQVPNMVADFVSEAATR